MLKRVPDHLKIKKMRKYEVKKLPFVIKYVPHQNKTHRMCDEVILENAGL